jgi:hypothetical protein
MGRLESRPCITRLGRLESRPYIYI